MNEIRNLQDLEFIVGKNGAVRLFTEYMMELVAKAELLDRISDAVANNADMQSIKEILYGADGCSSDETGSIV